MLELKTELELQPMQVGGEKKPPLPEGIYVATFCGYEDVPAKEHNGKMLGAARRWWFQVAEGIHTGRYADNFGPVAHATTNMSGKILGGMFPDGLPSNVSVAVGKKFQIVVSKNGGGRHVVNSVFPI